VRKVLRSNSPQVPAPQRAEKAEPYRQQILSCCPLQGNLVRVHEELTASGAILSYQALTAFCRRHGLTELPQQIVGQYDFRPGQELQHDTSPHELELAGKKCKGRRPRRRCATAHVVLQCYQRFSASISKSFSPKRCGISGAA
jgi:hypothetical protein